MEQRDRDILDRMGTRMLAQAVLLVTSVTNVETKAMMKFTSNGSKFWTFSVIIISKISI